MILPSHSQYHPVLPYRSGWPVWMGEDVNKRQRYVQDYVKKEGIQLDAIKIEKNPGRSSRAKMMLNSFWGKNGQKGIRSQVVAMSFPTRLYSLLNDGTRELQTLRVINDEMIEVVYKHVSDEDPVQVSINIFVACFTTCWIRLKNYREGLAYYPSNKSSFSTPIPSSSPIDPVTLC